MAKTAAAQAKWNEATELYGQIQGVLALGELGQEKQNELDVLFTAFDAAEAEAKKLDAIAERAANIGERAKQAEQAVGRLGSGGKTSESLSGERQAARSAYQKLLKVGDKHLSEMERKALRADVASEGGFFLAPQEVTAEYVKFVDDLVFIRELATVYQLDMSESLGIPTIESDMADADWTSELLTGSEDAGLKAGKRELKPIPLAKRIRVSRKLLRQSRFDPETLIRERMGYKFAVSMEKGFMTGSGANQPLGVFTPSADGISIARNVATAGASAIVADDLINVKHNLKAAYWARPNTRWIFGRPVISAIRKLKDTTGNYIWAPGLGPGGGLTGGLPPTILDVPYVVSEYAPSTITTGLYTGIIGDFSFYWIAEVLQLEIQVLMELYAATNQVGYIGRMELDGMPVIEEAFSRMIQA